MDVLCRYDSPLGRITITSDGDALTGLWFDGQNSYPNIVNEPHMEAAPDSLPVFEDTIRWLDTYFSGKEPDFTPKLNMKTTDFRKTVWNILLTIPYGETITYADVARRVAEKQQVDHMSSQAVGGAVGQNNILLIIPCHRVIGTNGSLTGYAAGLDRKLELLRLEEADLSNISIPDSVRIR